MSRNCLFAAFVLPVLLSVGLVGCSRSGPGAPEPVETLEPAAAESDANSTAPVDSAPTRDTGGTQASDGGNDGAIESASGTENNPASPAPAENSSATAERGDSGADSGGPANGSATRSPANEADDPTAAEKLEEKLSAFTIPPAWVADVQPRWDVSKPWKDARLEIRRLLGTNVEADRREGIKLLWEYHRKNDIGDGHEYGFDLYLGGESLWAIKAYRDWLPRRHDYLFVRGHTSLASLYVKYGAFELAEAALQNLMRQVPHNEFPVMRQAETHDAFGDLYVAWGKLDQAKQHYRESVRLYPQGKPKYGRHLLPRRAKGVQAKLDLLSYGSLKGTKLRAGRFQASTLGYSGDLHLTVVVKAGRVEDIQVRHQEKIDQNACVIIPQRIVSSQSLKVDGITGATITKDAIVGGTFQALRKAGLR